LKIEKVQGTDKRHKVFIYALSTCAWCKKTKKYLQDKSIEYEFVDVDLCDKQDIEKIRQDLSKRGLQMNFPTVMVDDKTYIVGFREDKLEEAFRA